MNLSTVSIGSTVSSFIKNILRELKSLNNKHNWKNETIDGLIVKYFKSKNAISKLFMYEMDIINCKVNEHFGIYLFQKKDSKTVRVNKMYAQLKRMPQLLNYESSSDNMETVFQPKALTKIYMDFILGVKYPKEYLAAPICCIGCSKKRHQIEMRTFDYTHILNNFRFHVCNNAFHDVSREAFIGVSEVNHDILRRAIVKDKLDRQNCAISRRFFSSDI